MYKEYELQNWEVKNKVKITLFNNGILIIQHYFTKFYFLVSPAHESPLVHHSRLMIALVPMLPSLLPFQYR
jgi:hypothetical protein